jgi:sn-glycerol 3-phosphate transport system substrate-binding protein
VPEDLKKMWYETLVQVTAPFFKIKDEWIAYPTSSDPGVMVYYNVDHFKEVGLNPNKPPKTFDELLEYAKKPTKYDASG